MYYLLLPIFFILAIIVEWFRNPTGSPEFVQILKRTVIATLLVASYQEISDTILAITGGIADKISDMSGLDAIIQMAGEKAKSYTLAPMSLVLGFNDLIIAVLSFLSYVVLYIAQFITVAIFHFMWVFLSISAPLLILFNLFQGTTHITVNLFKSLIEVASYKIVWAILSAMITALSFGNAYAADGNYLTVIVLNFVIAVAMLGTPMIVKALVGSGLSSVGQTLATATTVAIAAAPARAAMSMGVGREVLSNTAGFGNVMKERMQGPKPFVPDMPDMPKPTKDYLNPNKHYAYPELPPDFKEKTNRKWF